MPPLLHGRGPITPGARVAVSASGTELTLLVPAGRQLDRARLEISAVPDADAVLPVSSVSLISDAGPLPAGAARSVTASWPVEVAVAGVQIATTAENAWRSGARLRLLSGGVWLPLAPQDTLVLSRPQNFPAISAAAVFAELLVHGTFDGKPSGVLLPGPVAVDAITVSATRQPCRVTAAIGDDPPFFIAPDPLPLTAVVIDGLAQAANRYLLDRPSVTAVPLRFAAAGPAEMLLRSFVATLLPLPQPSDVSSEIVPAEDYYLRPAQLSSQRAYLCDATHAAAQCFTALPPGRRLAGVGLYLRRTCETVVGTIELLADVGDRPADAAAVSLPFGADTAVSPDGAWTDMRLASPLALSAGRWWLACRVQSGTCLWYVGTARPAEATQAMTRLDSNPWIPAQAAAASGWLQARLRVVSA